MKVPASAAPMCKLCGARHSFAEPHVYPDATHPPRVTPAVPMQRQSVPKEPTATRGVPSATAYVPTEAEMIDAAVSDSHECPICGFIHHRPLTSTERSRVWRERHATP